MTQRTRSGFQTELDAKIAANGSRAITGPILNDVIEDLKDSAMWRDEGPLPAWLLALPTFTPVLTDVVLSLDDPAGTPALGRLTWASVFDLFKATGGANASFIGAGQFADARISESSVKQHEAALEITEAQITDLQDYLLSSSVGVSVQPFDSETLKADETKTLTAGFTTTLHNLGTATTGTVTPDYADGNMQVLTNGGSFALAPPAESGTMMIEMTNGATPGTVDLAGFDSVTGDPLTTVIGHRFALSIATFGSRAYLSIIAAADNA